MLKINLDEMPDKLYMADLSAAFGMKGQLQEANLHTILFAARCNKLPIYFDSGMYGAEISDGVEPIMDEYGEIIKLEVLGDGILTTSNQCTLVNGLAKDKAVLVSSYTNADKTYYPIDETGMWVSSKLIPANNFYCDKEELSASGLLNNSPTSTRSRRLTKQQQREEALKYFLSMKSGVTINNSADSQTAYEIIGEPTKKRIWELLQEFDTPLYSAGKDDFLTDQNLIQFKIGTSKGRVS